MNVGAATIYRPDIDGLRALAVVLVFAFHFGNTPLVGGFIGVDVFFVISGFLITGIIYRDLAEDSFRFERFYQRRVARILPSSALVSIATVLVAVWTYAPQDLASVGATFSAVAIFVANLKFMLQGNYFAVSRDSQPLLHYWSLSLEEQFYFLFPLVLAVLYRVSRQKLVAVLAVASIAGFLTCVYMTAIRQTWAFYSLPARMWELGVGATLAVWVSQYPQQALRLSSPIYCASGLVLIISGALLIEEGKSFPGWFAFVPVAGAALIVTSADRTSIVYRVLASRFAVGLGKRSFVLYLWHWPVFSFVDYILFVYPAWARTTWKLVIVLVVTELTHRLFEKPARAWITARHAPPVLLASVLAIGVMAVCGYEIRRHNYVDSSVDALSSGGLEFSGVTKGKRVVLLGDSNGSMYAKTLVELCRERCSKFNVLSVAAADILPSGNPNVQRNWSDALQFIQKSQSDIVILAYHWLEKVGGDPTRIEQAIRDIRPWAGRIVLLTQPPILPISATRDAIREGFHGPMFEVPDVAARRKQLNAFLSSLSGNGVVVLDIASKFELSNQSIEYIGASGELLYHDATHLSYFGAQYASNLLATQLVND